MKTATHYPYSSSTAKGVVLRLGLQLRFLQPVVQWWLQQEHVSSLQIMEENGCCQYVRSRKDPYPLGENKFRIFDEAYTRVMY